MLERQRSSLSLDTHIPTLYVFCRMTLSFGLSQRRVRNVGVNKDQLRLCLEMCSRLTLLVGNLGHCMQAAAQFLVCHRTVNLLLKISIFMKEKSVAFKNNDS